MLPEIIEQVNNSEKLVSIPSKLFERNIITLFDEINSETAYEVILQLLYLAHSDNCKEIDIYINTPGGNVMDGLAICDTIRIIEKPVNVIVCGSAMSMGAIILLSATGKRKMLKNSVVMIHSVRGSLQGSYHDQKSDFEETERLQKDLIKIICGKIDMSFEEAMSYFVIDRYYNSELALKNKIVDEVL